jgi:hypothetical protein
MSVSISANNRSKIPPVGIYNPSYSWVKTHSFGIHPDSFDSTEKRFSVEERSSKQSAYVLFTLHIYHADLGREGAGRVGWKFVKIVAGRK